MNIYTNIIKHFVPYYKSLFFFFSSNFIFANEDIFKSDNDIFNDEEINTSTENFNFIKKMRIKNTPRIYLGAYLPIPLSMGVLGKYIYDNNLNIIENEAISTNLDEGQKEKYIIYDEITNYNNNKNSNSQINDCFKIKDEIFLNDYMARYEVNKKEELAVPIYFTNLLKFATIMGKMNEYNNKNTECEFGLHGLEGEEYKNRLGETIKNLTFLKKEEKEVTCFLKIFSNKKENEKREEEVTTISEEIKKKFEKSKYKKYNNDAIDLKICHLNNLEKQQKTKELNEHMTYGKIKPFKILIYYNFNCGISNTFWINKRIGWDVDFSGSFSYFDFKKSLFLTKIGDGAKKLIFGILEKGNGNIEFGILKGNILNQKILKQESEKKAINEDGEYNFLTGVMSFLGIDKLYYCTQKSQNTRDCATNFFVTKNFIFKKQPTGCFNIGCTLKQINICLKTGIAINLSNSNLLLKNYQGKFFNKFHQLVFNIGCIANINFWNLNLNFDIDEKALKYEGEKGNKDNYKETQTSYIDLFKKENIKKMVSWLKEDFIQKYKFRPMFEIKYRIDSKIHVSFEIGLRFIFRSAFNFDIDKTRMKAYWEKLENKEIPKYDDTTTPKQLEERKKRILKNIDNFGIKWFYNFDMCLFFSIGFNILK